jgi:hypothetical protein
VSLADFRGPEQVLRITDWSGGEGGEQHDLTPTKYRTGRGIDVYSVPGAVQLGPHCPLVQSTAENVLGPMTSWGPALYVATAAGNVFKWDGAAWAFVFTIAQQITCIETFVNRLYVGNVLNGALVRWDGVAAGAPVSAPQPIYCLRTHYRQTLQYLYVGSTQAGANAIGRIYYFDRAALSAGQYDTEEYRPNVAFVLDQRLYFCAVDHTGTRWGLYSVDDATAGGTWRAHVRPMGGYPVSAAVVNGVAYIGDQSSGRIWAWDGSDLVTVRELGRTGVAYSGTLAGMAARRGALWVGVIESAGSCSLLRYAPSASSEPALSGAKGQAAWTRPVQGIAATDIASLGIFADVLYVGTQQTGAAKLYRVLNNQFGASGVVTSGLIDCALPGVSKLLRSVTIVTAAIVSPQTIQVEYQLEDAGAWTSLGTLSTVGATTATYSFGANTTARQVAFRVTLSGTAGATTSPILYELTLRYVPRPAVAREWDLAVLLEGTAELPMVTLDGANEPSTGAALMAALWTAATANGPLTYVDLDGTSYQVYVDDVREEVGTLSQRRGMQRVGLVKLVEAA